MKKALPIATAVTAAALLPGTIITGQAFAHMRKRPIKEIYATRSKQPDFVPLQDMPERLVQLTLESEDSGFYDHGA